VASTVEQLDRLVVVVVDKFVVDFEDLDVLSTATAFPLPFWATLGLRFIRDVECCI